MFNLTAGQLGHLVASGAGAGGGGVPAADITLDFVNQVYTGTTPANWTVTRAGGSFGDNTAGIWTQFAANTAVITNKGLQIAPAATNIVLQNRNMVLAAWVKTGMTALHTSIGIDGAANAASQITATAASGTSIQALTAASAGYTVSFFLQRVTGTGVVNITADGGATWTPVVPPTGSYQRFSIGQTLANPSPGIQLVTSGDVVMVDMAQCEASSTTIAVGVATSPIQTAGATITRSSDRLSIPVTPGSSVTILGQGYIFGGQAGSPTMMGFSDNTANNRVLLQRFTTNPRGAVVIAGTLTQAIIASPSWADGVPIKIAISATTGAGSCCFNGGIPSDITFTGFPTGMIQIDMGPPALGTNGYFYITSAKAWLNYAAPDTVLQALTT